MGKGKNDTKNDAALVENKRSDAKKKKCTVPPTLFLLFEHTHTHQQTLCVPQCTGDEKDQKQLPIPPVHSILLRKVGNY